MVEVTNENPIKPEAPKQDRNNTLWKVSAGIATIALCWFLYWYFYLQYHIFTDDAFAGGNMVNINSPVSGSVVAYYADDTDFVAEGQLLVQLDDTSYRLAYEKEVEALASIILDVRQLYDNVGRLEALVSAKQTSLEKARYDYDNRAKLISSKAISNEDFTHSHDNVLIAEAEHQQARMQLRAALDAIGGASLQNHPWIEKQKTLVRKAYYNLHHCAIRAPSTGYVAQRSVEVGQWVTPTANIMAVIPTDYVWVDANYKETQLTKMRVGQPATVRFDLYGSDVKFDGKVLGIASGTGSVFSIIPPQNATGNWIKIVQRLPVRIGLNGDLLKKYPLRLGISAEVEVDVTEQDLPYLNMPTPTQAVAKTSVFHVDFEAVNKLMDGMIQANMN